MVCFLQEIVSFEACLNGVSFFLYTPTKLVGELNVLETGVRENERETDEARVLIHDGSR